MEGPPTHRDRSSRERHLRCERAALDRVQHEPVDHRIRPGSPAPPSAEILAQHKSNRTGVRDGLFEAGAARVEVVAEPVRDEDVADRRQAGREARDGADLGQAEVEQAARAEAASRVMVDVSSKI